MKQISNGKLKKHFNWLSNQSRQHAPFCLHGYKNDAKQCAQIASSVLFDLTRFSVKSIEQSILILGMWGKPLKVCFNPNTNGKQVQKQLFKVVRKLTLKSALIF